MYPAVLMSVLPVFAAGTVRLLPFVCVTLIVYGGMLLLLVFGYNVASRF